MTVIIDITWAFVINGINLYANLNKWLFLAVNVVSFLLVFRINWICFRNIVTRRIKFVQKLSVSGTLMLILGCVGFYFIWRINSNVIRITDTSQPEVSVSSSFVSADNSILSLSDLDGTTIGFMIDNGQNGMAKQNLETDNIAATYVNYENYDELLAALSSGEVQAAVLPSDYQTSLAGYENLSSVSSDLHVLSTVELGTSTTENTQGNDIDLTTTPFTVLIAGIDEGRSDALMVASFNPYSLRLTLTSIPRDSYVHPACYVGEAKDKINAARSVSRDCMIATVEDYLGINIDFYFESNFSGVVDLVDALGGITIYSDVEFDAQNSDAQRGHYTVHIYEGEQRLDGEGALAYARERYAYLTGDFQRQQNQQQVIEAILTEALRIRDVNTMLNMLDAAGDNISTNFSVDQLVSLFNYIAQKAQRFPSEEHIEDVIQIVNSRVTAYNSFLWNEASYQTTSIVIPFEGSWSDNRDFILSNLEVADEQTVIEPTTGMTFDASYDFNQPVISYDEYAEQRYEPTLTESYYCYVAGGTWTDGVCGCAAGQTYVDGQGCVAAAATDFSAYTDQSSCNAAGGLFVWTSNACVSACPAGTHEDGIGGCVGD